MIGKVLIFAGESTTAHRSENIVSWFSLDHRLLRYGSMGHLRSEQSGRRNFYALGNATFICRSNSVAGGCRSYGRRLGPCQGQECTANCESQPRILAISRSARISWADRDTNVGTAALGCPGERSSTPDLEVKESAPAFPPSGTLGNSAQVDDWPLTAESGFASGRTLAPDSRLQRCHLHRRQRRLKSLVPHLQPGPINGLLQIFASKHAKRMRHASLLRRLTNSARYFVYDHVIVRRIAAQQTTQANDGIVFFGFRQLSRGETESRRPPARASLGHLFSSHRNASAHRLRSTTAAR